MRSIQCLYPNKWVYYTYLYMSIYVYKVWRIDCTRTNVYFIQKNQISIEINSGCSMDS
jgi:hypothetical protein